jgi:glucan-binding YG repeat protein
MVKNGWELVGSYWYYFDNNGKMKTGWLKWNNDWYYLTPKTGTGSPVTSATGRMATGFCPGIMRTPDGVALPSPGKTYFFKSNGALNGKGWIQYNKKWHYLQDDGTVKTGWFREGTKWYYLRDDTNPIGEMVTGVFDVPTTLADGTPNTPNGTQSFKANGEWIGAGDQIVAGIAGKWGKDSNGKWHWYDANGNSVTGWQLIDNKWYYLSPSSTPVGVMVTGFQNIDGDCFYFKPDGALQAGWQLVDGVWYYFNPNHDGNYGAMRKGWQEINGEWYYLDPTTGACQTGWIENPAGSDTWYYLNTANEGTYGAMHHGGWMKLGNKWYYLNPKADGYYGRQIQGWVTDGGQKYYMQKSGNPAEAWMLTGRVVGITEWQTDTGSYNYYFDPDGHMVTNADRGGYHYGPDGKET